MKKVLFYISLFLVFSSCDQKGSLDAPLISGKKVQITVNTNDNGSNSRKISGSYSISNVSFTWNWNKGNDDKLYVETEGDPTSREEFTMVDCSEGVATFEGVLPQGCEGKKLHILAGNVKLDYTEDNEWPSLSQSVKPGISLAENVMRFEATVSSINEPIELVAAWSVICLNVPFYIDPKTDMMNGEEAIIVKPQVNQISITGSFNGDAMETPYVFTPSNRPTCSFTQDADAVIKYLLIVKPGTYTNLNISVVFGDNDEGAFSGWKSKMSTEYPSERICQVSALPLLQNNECQPIQTTACLVKYITNP